VLHLLRTRRDKSKGASIPRFIKDLIRRHPSWFGSTKKKDELSLIFGGGIAMAEHVRRRSSAGRWPFPFPSPALSPGMPIMRKVRAGNEMPVEVEKINPSWAGRNYET